MKREEILFYLASDVVHVYLTKSKKEYIEQVDTSPFFKCGEISSVKQLREYIEKFASKLNFGLYYLKPELVVLYNDVCAGDVKYLYRHALSPFGYSKASFVPLSRLVKKIKDDEKVVVCDGNCYTLIDSRRKVESLKGLEFEPIVLGETSRKHIHHSDKEILWKTFKSCFTKGSRYGMMDVGDD